MTTDPGAALSALETARTAVADAQALLWLTRHRADAVGGAVTWVSPSADRFRTALAGWAEGVGRAAAAAADADRALRLARARLLTGGSDR